MKRNEERKICFFTKAQIHVINKCYVPLFEIDDLDSGIVLQIVLHSLQKQRLHLRGRSARKTEHNQKNIIINIIRKSEKI